MACRFKRHDWVKYSALAENTGFSGAKHRTFIMLRTHKVLDNLLIISTITCAGCGSTLRCKMPLHASRTHFECPHCKAVFKTGEEECCIYCSYGSVPCPSAQLNGSRKAS
jgi:hypothetical protein